MLLIRRTINKNESLVLNMIGLTLGGIVWASLFGIFLLIEDFEPIIFLP